MKISEIISFLEELQADMGDMHISVHVDKSESEELIFDEETDTISGF
jgi:hypothetical protein